MGPGRAASSRIAAVSPEAAPAAVAASHRLGLSRDIGSEHIVVHPARCATGVSLAARAADTTRLTRQTGATVATIGIEAERRADREVRTSEADRSALSARPAVRTLLAVHVAVRIGRVAIVKRGCRLSFVGLSEFVAGSGCRVETVSFISRCPCRSSRGRL